jgi:phosphomevalonate kinase
MASAPGKLVLAGEYAVLDGAPAIVMAVDRRAVVSVAAS